MAYRITESCTKCGLCLNECPLGAIDDEVDENICVINGYCDECGICLKICPVGAIVKDEKNVNGF